MPNKNVGEAIRKSTKTVTHEAVELTKKTYSTIEKQGIGFWITIGLIFLFSLMLFFVKLDTIYELVVFKYGLLGLFVVAFITDMLLLPAGVDIPLILAFSSNEISSVEAFLVVMAGVLLAIVVSYYIGWRWGIAGIEAMVGKSNFHKFKKYKKWGKRYLFLSAITPLLYLPYFAGVWKLSWKECAVYLFLPKGLRYLFYLSLVLLFDNAVLTIL